MINLKELTIAKISDHLRKGDFTSRQLVEAYIESIKEKNPEVNAYLEVFSDALDQADTADKMIKDGLANVLTGIPFAIKDNILIDGRNVTASSKISKVIRRHMMQQL